MKQFILSITFCFSFFMSFAQDPVKKTTPLFFKFSATWCYPCGQWGNPLAKSVYEDAGFQEKALYLYGQPDNTEHGVTDGPSPNHDFNNRAFYSSTAKQLFNMLGGTGLPSFYVNTDEVLSYTKDSIIAKVNAASVIPPVASAAAIMTISGDTVRVTAKAKFWEPATGEFYLTAYLVQGVAMNYQNGHPEGMTQKIPHKDLLRGSMTPNSEWGTLIASTSVAANAEITKTYSMGLNPAWNESELNRDEVMVYMVIWKKNGTKYEFINAAKAAKSATPIDKIASNITDAHLFPNPTSNATNLSLSLRDEKTISITMTDALGRTLYKSTGIKLTAGNHVLSIPSGKMGSGIFNITITSNAGDKLVRRLVIAGK